MNPGAWALVLTVAAISTSSGLFVLRSPLSRPRDVALAVPTLMVCVAAALALVWGAGLHLLHPLPVLVSAVAFAALAAAVSLSPARRAVSLAKLDDIASAVRATARELRADPISALLLTLAIVAIGFKLLQAARLPATDWDTLGYHSWMTDSWVRAGAIGHVPFDGLGNGFVRPSWSDTYPGNGDLFSALTMVFLRSDVLSDAAQVPFALLGSIATAVAARSAGIPRARSVAAGCLFALTPVVLVQLHSGLVDVTFAALATTGCSLLALAFVTGHLPAPARTTLVALAGAALGLAVGTKASAPLFGGAAMLALLAAARSRKLDRRTTLQALAVLVLPMLAFGSYWSVRNLLTYGNPTFPVDLAVGPVVVVEGPITTADVIDIQRPPALTDAGVMAAAVARSWFAERPSFYDQNQLEGGLGLQWPWLLLPSMLLAGAALWRTHRLLIITFVLPLTVPVAFLPGAWWARLTLVLVPPGAVSFMALVASTRSKAVRGIVLVALAAMVLASTQVVLGRTSHGGRVDSFGDTWAAVWAPDPQRRLGAFAWPEYASAADLPPGSVVAVWEAALVFPHPLVGEDLDRDVVTVEPATSQHNLEQQLAERRATHLFAQVGSVEDAYAARGERRFREVGEAGGWRTWEFIPDGSDNG